VAEHRWAADEAGAPRDVRSALGVVLAWLQARVTPLAVRAIGHRVVHGGTAYAAPIAIDGAVLAELQRLVPLAPLHEPHNLEGVRAARERFPGVPQVACFDTAFHRGHAFAEEAFALPREFYDAGVRRYGFHGLSYEYVADRLARLSPQAGRGRVVVAHLGSGASACAIRDGRSVSSTMGFTALDGLVMGTRPGQIDPGVLLWMMTDRGMDAAAITELLYRRSGLKGLSGVSNDMRDLRASAEPAARAAIEVFVARLVREVGALSAVLEGLDALVFTAGIGENDAALRAQACARLHWLGVALDEAANAAHGRGRDGLVSAPHSRVEVRVIPTDEERMIARHLQRLLPPGRGRAQR
jgi:acetate kinase